MVERWFWVHKIVFAVPGGLPAPKTLGGGLAAPRAPPAYREAPPLGLSVFFGTKILVPRSWYQNLGSGSWYQVACRVPNVACHAVSIPFVSKSSVLCRVINLRVGVSVPRRGHPASMSSARQDVLFTKVTVPSSFQYNGSHLKDLEHNMSNSERLNTVLDEH